MLEVSSHPVNGAFWGSRRGKVSQERQPGLQNCKRILCVFKVDCLYDVILGNENNRSQNNGLFSPMIYSFLP